MVEKESFVIKVGPLLKSVIDKQRQNVKKETYGVCNSSDYEAGEIIAKKISENNLV